MSVIKLRKPEDVEYEDIPIQCLMDIEASSLSDESYPIEIAYTDRITKTTIFLIKPLRRGPTGSLSEELYHRFPAKP